jgi:hypothetical protein
MGYLIHAHVKLINDHMLMQLIGMVIDNVMRRNVGK